MKRLSTLLSSAVAFALALGALVAPPAVAAPQDDVKTVISRLQDYYLGQGDEIIIANGIYLAQTSRALEYVDSQRADGSWADVDYADRTSSANGSVWSAYIALYRMLAMTHAFRDPDAAGYGDRRLVDAVERALLYWDRVNPGNSNWWETEIGESIAMGRISMFLGDELSPAALQVALTHNTGKIDPVGANGSWRTSNYLFEALSTGDIDKVTQGFAAIVETITVDRSGAVNEAVQPDGSFWAHGAQLYSEGYGMVLFTYAALWADVARGTGLAFTRDQLDAIAFYFVDGTRWMIRGEIGMLYLNYRPAKTNQQVTSYASDFIEPLQRMVRTDPLYATAYAGVLDGILGKTRTNGVTGNTYFWRSEFSSHLREKYGIFTRLNSSRTFGAELRTSYRDEVGNPVYWNAMGSTAIQVTNHEYADLGPAFDWWHYPGVTAPYEKRTERGFENRGRNGDGASFTGGVSDGRYGASVLTLDSAGTTAKKSYFQFDDEMVALGADIASSRAAAVHTTINQVVSADNATVGGQRVTEGTSAQSIGAARWAYNDEVGYVFADGQDIAVSNKAQTGSWEGEDAVTRDVFSLYVDHGARPTAGAYDYTVLPAATPTQVEAYAASPKVRTLRNDGEVQAVRHDGAHITMATFHQAGSLDLGSGRTLSVDQPSIVILDERGQTPVVSVANPDRPGLVVRVALTGGAGAWHGVFALGAKENTGKTSTAPLERGAAPAASDYSASGTDASSSLAALGDGNRDTVWQSAGEGAAWVVQRLPRGSWVTTVTLDWADNAARDYIVQTSTDGITWTDRARETAGEAGKVEIPVDPAPAELVRVVMLDGDGAGYGIREFAATGGVNLAIDSGTRASGYSGYNLVYALADGDSTTRWRGNNADSAWAQIDLGRSRTVAAVRLEWEAAFAKNYKIQLSADGSTWRDVYTTPAAGSDGGIDTITFAAQTARYVRMQTVTRALNYGPSLWEFQVFGDRAVIDAPAVAAESKNLALGRPTTADSVHNNLASIVAAKATDGAAGTKWSSARPVSEHWLQVDLERVRSVSSAVVKWEAGTSHDYRIEGSVDGSTWRPLARVQQAQASLTHRFDFAAASVRYVRLTGLPATQYGLNIWEFELYGGSTLECTAPATIVAGATGATGAATMKVSPVDADDVFRAATVDTSVARVASAPRPDANGRIDVELTAVRPGLTDVVLTHQKGDETAWCSVVVNADTARLTTLIDRANALASVEYTASSWAPVLVALSHAKDVRARSGAGQDLVDEATAGLQAALDGLRSARDTERPLVHLAAPTAAGPFRTLEITLDATDDVALKKIVANVYNASGVLVKSTQTAVADGATAAQHTASVSLPDGSYTLRYNAHDVAGNVSKTGTHAFAIDGTKPRATVKEESSFTVRTGETYDLISFKLYDAQKIDKVELNGVVKNLTDNTWSDVNFVKPGVFGAVRGQNTLVVFDVAGNTETCTFTLN
jgi:hypothetical protein